MKRRIFIFTLLLCASAAFAAGGDVMRLSPVGYRLGAAGDIAAYDPSVVTVTPDDTSIVTSNKSVALAATLNRDYKVVCWQKFADDPTIRADADPIEEFGEGSESVSVDFATNVTWMYVTVVVKYDPTRTVKVGLSSFGKGSVTVSPEKETYLKGDVVTLTAEPADGHSFVRWSDGNDDHVRTLTVDGDIELKAYIEPISSRVTFSAGEGAILDVTSKRVSYDCAYGELPVPVREGLVFVGWADEFGTMITSESTSDHAGDHVLTAVWEIPPASYTVVFDANGGTGMQTRVEQKFEVGVSQKLRINTFYNSGHVFIGWNQNAGAEEKQYSDEQIVQDLAPDGATLTLFAVWRTEKVAYEVRFDKNAADATGTMINQQFAGGEEKPLFGCNFRRTGWTFLGWSTDKDAVEAAYQDREKVQDLTTQKELTLYAVWTKNPVYYINYMVMDRDSEPWKSETVEQRKEYMLFGTNGLERTGYIFAGWRNETAKATYPAGKKCTTQELEKMVDDGDTITFVASWDPITYTLKFDGNGGTCKLTPKTLTYDFPEKIEYEGGKVSRDHYEFQFWSADQKETNLVYRWSSSSEPVVTNLTTVADDTVVWYAIWKGTNVTVKVNNEDKQLEYGSQLDKPADPVKTGYTFAGGWQTNGVPVTFPITVTGSFDLEPEDDWAPIEYAVSFHGTDGTYETDGTMADQPFTYDVEQALTSNGFTRTGYSFANWTNNVGKTFADGARVKNLATNNGAVVDLYATWTMIPHYYTVRFNPNGGEGNAYAQTIECGVKTALTPNRFARTGYGFANWTNVVDSTAYTNCAVVTDIAAEGETNDLYAVWAPSRYWVAFDANGGTGSMAAQAFTYDVAQALTSNAFTRTGYGFAGWVVTAPATRGASGTVDYADGEVVSNLTAVADATNTLWAAWTVKSYEISFDSAGGSAVAPVTNEFGKAVSAPTPTKKGYQFDGWYEGKVKFDFSSMPARNVRLTAHWAANEYTVHFNSGEGTGAMGDQGFTYDVPQNLTANGFTAPERMVFDCWTNAAGDAFADRALVTNLVTEGVCDLYAVWTDAPNYTVRFNPNGGAGEPYMQNVLCGVATALTPNRFARTGYGFAGWDVTAPATRGVSGTVVYTNCAIVTDLAVADATNDLYAVWTPNRYWVAFEPNGGTGSMAAQKFTYDEAKTLTKNTFTRKGYGFAGWVTNLIGSAVFEDEATVSNLTAEPDATNTLWATWMANQYKVVYHGPSGATSDQAFTYDQSQKLRGADTFAPPEEWMVFAGWTNAVKVYAAGASVSNLTDVADGTVDLYAKWADDSYTVTFDGNDATGGTMDPQVFKHGETRALNANEFKRTGHTFVNWTDADGKTYDDKAEFTAPANGNGETLQAEWNKNTYTDSFDGTTETFKYGEIVTRGAPSSKEGYTFKGWTTNGSDVIDLGSGTSTFAQPDHDVAFTSKWEAITYTIAFDGNGTTTVAMAPTNVKYDVEFVLPPNTYVRTGYEFVQWTNSVGETFSDGATVKKNLATTDGATVTLYAVWKETGDPLRMALGLGSEFDGKISVSAEGAWTVIEPAKNAKGVIRNSTSADGQLRIAIPSGGRLLFTFEPVDDGAEALMVKKEDGSWSRQLVDGILNYSVTFDEAGAVIFSGTPTSDATWTLKDFTWTPAK